MSNIPPSPPLWSPFLFVLLTDPRLLSVLPEAHNLETTSCNPTKGFISLLHACFYYENHFIGKQ